VYTVPSINTVLSNATLEPDPITNPLGIFYSPDRLYLHDNVTVRGTLITNTSVGDIFIEGSNVQVSPASLLPLAGTTTPVQLPVMMVRDDLRVFATAGASIQGMAAVWDEVEFKQGPQQNINFQLEGRLLGKQFYVRGRDQWDQVHDWWEDAYNGFMWSKQNGGTPYFPVWLQANRGLAYTPRIRIKPSASAVTYHWRNAADPIYVPHAADPGLRWDVVDWVENP
jgi:hypothetical protein